MTAVEIDIEFWAAQFHKVIERGRIPEVDEFDTDFVDDAVEAWAREDAEAALFRKISGGEDWDLIDEF